MNITCSAKACPVLLSASCVFYEGVNLPYTGINMNDNLQVALEKIDTKFNSLIDVNIYVSNGTITSNRTVALNGKTLSFIGSSYTTIFQPTGTFQLGSLAGVGNRMVIADASGVLGTQAIPLGTVTSVDMSVPTGFAISGNPVTTSGTLALGFASGYSLPTNASQTNWNTAYNWVNSFPALVAGQYLTNNGTSLSWASIDLSGYVPYTGATADVNLGTHRLIADAISFSLTPTNSPGPGQIAYYGATGALAYLMDNTTVMCQIGQQLFAYVTNDDTVTIQKGQPVYLYSATGNRASVKLAANTGDATSAKTLGLAAENITSGQKGFVICQGVLDGLSTGMFNAGDTLYLGATAGSLTSTKPYAPNHLVYIGVVERANNGNGQIYVRPQNGYELDEIHDVDLISTPPVNGNVLTYVTGTNNLWKPRSIAAILGYTPANQATTLTINGTTYDLSANRTWSVGTVTSVSALTIGTTGTDITSSVATGTTTPVITLNVPTASATNRGALSSTDWTTFNNKYNLPALTSGSVLFSNGTTIAQDNSNFFWDNTNKRLGIGTNAPASRIDVLGNTNGNQLINIKNSNAGTAAICGFQANSDTGQGSLFITSSGYTPFGVLTANTLGFYSAGNVNIAVVVNSTGYYSIGTGAATPTEKFRLFNNGNVLIQNGGTFTDAGYRLDVNGTCRVQSDVTIKGSGATSASTALTVTDSVSTNLFIVRNDGISRFGNTIYDTTVNATGLIVGTSAVATSRVSVASAGNYQDAQFIATGVSSGNINSWSFGQRRDTAFGNTVGSFQIVGAYVNNSGTGSAVGGGYRVPLICNPNGDVIIAGASANAVNGNVLIGSTTSSGEKLQVTGDAKITGTMYLDSASDALFNFQNAGANKWRIGNAYVAGANYFQLYDSVNSLERIRWNNNSTATFTSDFTFVGGSNAVATFQAPQPDVKIQATGGSNAVSLTFTPSNGFEGVIQNNVTNGFIQVKTASTIRVTFKNGGQVNFQPLAADPAGASAGDVYYNSGTNKLRLYDGTAWVDLN